MFAGKVEYSHTWQVSHQLKASIKRRNLQAENSRGFQASKIKMSTSFHFLTISRRKASISTGLKKVKKKKKVRLILEKQRLKNNITRVQAILQTFFFFFFGATVNRQKRKRKKQEKQTGNQLS